MVRDPRVAFDQLFGAGGTPEAREARRRSSASILDFIVGEVNALKRELDPVDGRRVERYLSDIREIERRIERVVARNESGEQRRTVRRPRGMADSSTHVSWISTCSSLPGDVTASSRSRWGATPPAGYGSGVDKGFTRRRTTAATRAVQIPRINRYTWGWSILSGRLAASRG